MAQSLKTQHQPSHAVRLGVALAGLSVVGCFVAATALSAAEAGASVPPDESSISSFGAASD